MLFPASAMVAVYAPNFLLDRLGDNLHLQHHNFSRHIHP